jgi:hypothetical protein
MIVQKTYSGTSVAKVITTVQKKENPRFSFRYGNIFSLFALARMDKIVQNIYTDNIKIVFFVSFSNWPARDGKVALLAYTIENNVRSTEDTAKSTDKNRPCFVENEESKQINKPIRSAKIYDGTKSLVISSRDFSCLVSESVPGSDVMTKSCTIL